MSNKPSFKIIFAKPIEWFVRGILITTPLGITALVFYLAFVKLDGLFGFEYKGTGILLIFGIIIAMGIFGSSLITRPLFSLLETIMERTPGIKLIYTSLKDLMEAFVGEKKKFNKPVLIQVEGESVYKIGFVTSDALGSLDMEGFCSVYIPFSYTFSGHLYVVHTSKIKPIDGNSSDIMKFVASGGVTQL